MLFDQWRWNSQYFGHIQVYSENGTSGRDTFTPTFCQNIKHRRRQLCRSLRQWMMLLLIVLVLSYPSRRLKYVCTYRLDVWLWAAKYCNAQAMSAYYFSNRIDDTILCALTPFSHIVKLPSWSDSSQPQVCSREHFVSRLRISIHVQWMRYFMRLNEFPLSIEE